MSPCFTLPYIYSYRLSEASSFCIKKLNTHNKLVTLKLVQIKQTHSFVMLRRKNFTRYTFMLLITELIFKGCVCYICCSLFFKSKRKYLSNQEKCFLFYFKSSFCSRESQVLEFYIFKFHGIKCLSIKQETHFIE